MHAPRPCLTIIIRIVIRCKERETWALAVCLSGGLGGESKLSIQASQPHRCSTMDQWDNPEPQTERQAKMPALAVSLRLFAIQAPAPALCLDTRPLASLLTAGGCIIQRPKDRNKLNPNGYLRARPDQESSPLRLFAAVGTLELCPHRPWLYTTPITRAMI